MFHVKQAATRKSDRLNVDKCRDRIGMPTILSRMRDCPAKSYCLAPLTNLHRADIPTFIANSPVSIGVVASDFIPRICIYG
jgi:hypothetical protein